MRTTTATRLSERVRRLKPSATFAVTARVRALKAEGRDIIGFGLGEPDFDTAEPIKQAAIAALNANDTHYAPVPGTPEARAVIAEKLRRENGIECKPEHIVISCGAKQSIYQTLQCLVDPGRGQEVILPTPAWVSYAPAIELAGGTTVEVPGDVDNDFKITPDQLAGAISERTAAIIINSPSNPCGTMYGPEELRELARVLEPHEQITIIADEIYEKLVFGGIEHSSPGSIPSIADRVVTINGMSKAYAMTGWRIGYACAPGDDGALAAAMSRLQSQLTSGITTFCLPAIEAAFTRGAEAVERMRRTFAERAGIIHELVSAWPDVRSPRPTGAFYVFPDVSAHYGRTTPAGRALEGSLTFAEALLEETGVAVVPGADFGGCGDAHIRLSFATTNELITQGCQRIDRWLRTLA